MRRLAVVLLLTASTASADDRIVTSPAVGDLELTAKVSPEMLDVELTLRNTGKKSLDVRSHIQTYEQHFDWYEIELTWPKAASGKCANTGRLVLKLWDDRNKSYPVTKTLAPGATVVHTLSIPKWAARKVNGAVALGGSYYKVVARYRVKGEAKVWNGELVTPAAKVLGLDQMRTDVCPTNPGWDKW